MKEDQQSRPTCLREFEQNALAHLNSAYNLARWLTRNEQDAEDIVQEAYLRAFRFHHRFRGGDARPWLLKIVRNVYYTRLQRNRTQQSIDSETDFAGRGQYGDPEEMAIQNDSRLLLQRALETLSPRLREMLILRELEGMSYKEISAVASVRIGTVMSSLSRARACLRQSVNDLTTVRSDST
jgi:RNA polymerase sigma factor (sigma-70 family)